MLIFFQANCNFVYYYCVVVMKYKLMSRGAQFYYVLKLILYINAKFNGKSTWIKLFSTDSTKWINNVIK